MHYKEYLKNYKTKLKLAVSKDLEAGLDALCSLCLMQKRFAFLVTIFLLNCNVLPFMKNEKQPASSPEQLGQFFFDAVIQNDFAAFQNLFATKADFLFFLAKSNLSETEKKEHVSNVNDLLRAKEEIKTFYDDVLEEAAACKIDWNKATVSKITHERKTVAGVAQLRITVDWEHAGAPYQFVLRQCLEGADKWVITQNAGFFDPNWREKLAATVQIEKGFAGEQWPAALKRYEAFISQIERDSKLFFKQKDKIETITTIEARVGMVFPKALKNMYLNEGAFAIGDALEMNAVFLYRAEKLLYFLDEDFKALSISQFGLAEMIDFTIGHPELKELLSAEQYAYLNSNYKIFGVYYHNESDYRFYYFDETGKFGTVEYNHDWYHFNRMDWDNTFIPLTTKSKATLSFDALISMEIDEVIAADLEDWLDNGE